MSKTRFHVAQLRIFCFSLVFVIAHWFILNNIYLLSRDTLYADYSIEKVWPSPQYGVERIPDTPWAGKFNAYNHLAFDFAQVYFPSQEFDKLKSNYILGRLDPGGRPSRYAPFVLFLCSITFCKLNYGEASLFHLFSQLALFYFFFVRSFIILNIKQYIPLGVLIVNICLFLTPTGISWFERGQFSLYVSMSYLLVILWLLKRASIYVLLSALFAFIKWTSFPTIFVVLSVFIFASLNFKEVRIKVFNVLPFVGVILLLLIFFPVEDYYFLQGLYQQEFFATSQGISLVRMWPAVFVKFMPLLLIGMSWLYVRKYRNNLEEYLPFFTGAGILMLTFPTKAYEYNVSTLFCFIPMIIYWAVLAAHRKWTLVRSLMVYVFFIFLVFASYSRILVSLFETEKIVYLMYLVVTTVMLVAPLMVPSRNAPNKDHIQLDSISVV